MSDSEETLKQEPTLADVMKAVLETSNKLDVVIKRLDEHDTAFKAVDAQLESIREGIIHNASRFDRLESNIYSVRSDISNLKADIRDMGEDIRKDKLALK